MNQIDGLVTETPPSVVRVVCNRLWRGKYQTITLGKVPIAAYREVPIEDMFSTDGLREDIIECIKMGMRRRDTELGQVQCFVLRFKRGSKMAILEPADVFP